MTPVATPIDIRPLTSLRFLAALWVVVYLMWPNLAVGGMPARHRIARPSIADDLVEHLHQRRRTYSSSR